MVHDICIVGRRRGAGGSGDAAATHTSGTRRPRAPLPASRELNGSGAKSKIWFFAIYDPIIHNRIIDKLNGKKTVK